ncbi:hypothetical protein NH340_JMT00383 [Sarcoptes scabiei]|nr:hypothetical protein NH340_JMT00383 [Sarcoptes scabiei]
MLSDDLIAFRTQGASLGYRRPKSIEVPDYRYRFDDTNQNISEFYSSKFQKLSDRKHFLRLIVSEPLMFSMTHSYNQSGQYQIKFMVKNEFDDDQINRIQAINVQSTISKMRLTVKPTSVAVGKNVNVVVQLSKGSNIELQWDFGDGNRSIEHIERKYLEIC